MHSSTQLRRFGATLGVVMVSNLVPPLLTLAQPQPVPPHPLAITPTPGQQPSSLPREVLLPDGMELTLVNIEKLSSKHLRQGYPVSFRVDQDVIVNGTTVIRSGTLATGVVTDAERSGYHGKGGRLSVRVDSTTAVDGQRIKLRSSQKEEGGSNTVATIVVSTLVRPLPLGGLVKGKNAVIPAGTPVRAYVDGQTVVAIP